MAQHSRLGAGGRAPGALAITGVLILGLAVATARLMRATHPAAAAEPDAAAPPPLAHLPGRREPGAGDSPHRDLPKAS